MDDARRMRAALALAERGRGRTVPNPNVGCVIVADGRVVGRGWTQPGGRPHAEAMALAEAGEKSRGATCYVTLEPCAHRSERGPACSDLLAAAGVARVVAAIEDPDPRTAGAGFARLRAAGIAVTTGIEADAARRSMAGFLTRAALGRPFVTLKLATSLDGCIARSDGESRWITGAEARAHAHLERARHEAILVGRGTLAADAPRLDVRLAGLEDRSPQRVVLSTATTYCSPAEAGAQLGDERASIAGTSPTGPRPSPGNREVGDWIILPSPTAIAELPGDH
ncbi:bifunctional diaminohydroxyphosphoribosylaminopyrimidine deaminase/5-amino-6-(5-phosphoribosylamino)uracil reductase RibD, partial [Sphingomonas sp. KR1UV-12]